jgi:hypothetical protein
MFRIKNRERHITVGIITLSPIMLGHCEHCEILMKGFGIDYKPIQINEYSKNMIELSAKITRFINEITRAVYARVYMIEVYIIEALTLRGFIKMLLYRSGRLPIIAVNGRRIASGSVWEPEELARTVIKDLMR